ncbi:Uncharacterized protein QTN25_004356 [Entamoeba marina]
MSNNEDIIFKRDENGIRLLDLEYGDFPDDGYDYSKHFAERGCGIFIQADGKIIQPENRKKDTIEDFEDTDIPDDIDPEILAMLNGDLQCDGELEDDFVEIANGRKQTAQDAEFEKTLLEWDEKEGSDNDNEENHLDIEELCLFENGNPIDTFDMNDEFMEFDDDDVMTVMESIQNSTSKQHKPKAAKHPQQHIKTVKKEDLEIDPEILLKHAERVMVDEEEIKEKVILQTIATEDILQHQSRTQPKRSKQKNSPKVVKAPTHKKKTKAKK